MGLSTRDNAIYKMALEYWLNGASLDKAQAMAEAKYRSSLKRKGNYAITNQKAVQARLLLESKKSKAKFKKQDIAFEQEQVRRNKRKNKKIESDDKASNAKRAADRKKTLIGGFDNFPKKIGTIASYGAAIVVINKIVQAFTFAITKAIEFEKAFVDLQVKSGYSNRQLAQVSNTIIEVAQSTKFATLEIIAASTALGKLGFESEEVSEILPNLANVAAATGESLESTAQILGKVIRAYEYSAEQSGIISDRMVDIFNNSALNLEKFNTAFSYVGSAAASTGTSFNELTAAMAILADRGITASKIGTGLRNVFTKLGNEGDSLRDILQRINEAHLSFYEVAELVGRRAANQLFIMADSLDEFDANVARSSEDFGKSMEAAALQMDTFSAKWDILVNTMANTVLPEFDPDQTWRMAIADSLDLMDLFNAALSETNSKAIITRLVTSFKQFGNEFRAMQLQMKDANDEDILTALAKKAQEGTRFGSPEQKKAMQEYAQMLNKLNLLVGDEDNRVSEALGLKDIQKKVNEGEKALLKWQGAIDNIYIKIEGKRTKAEADNFVQMLFNQEDYKGVVEKYKAEGLLTKEDIDAIYKTQDYNWTVREKQSLTYRKGSLVTYGAVLEKQYGELLQSIRDKNDGKLVTYNDKGIINLESIVAEDKNAVKKMAKDLETLRNTMCKETPDIAKRLGFKCDEKKDRSRAAFEKFDKFTDADNQYRIDKALYKKLYMNETDANEKSKILYKLDAIEGIYRDKLNKRYDDYLNKMESRRDAFMAKYPKGIGAYDANIDSVSNSQGKDAATGTINQNNYANTLIEQNAKKFKKDIVAFAEYGYKMSKLKNDLQSKDRKDVRGRKAVIDEMNRINKEYYDGEIARLTEHAEEVNNQLQNTIEGNQIREGNDQPLIGTKKIIKLYKQLQAELFNLKKEQEDGEANPKKTDVENFNWVQGGADIFDDVLSVYTQIGDMKIALLEEQTAIELEVIQDRFDKEGLIRQSALDSGIISQEEAVRAEERARKTKIDNENKANKKLFEAKKKQDKQTAILQGISSTAQATALAFTKGTPVEAIIMAAISGAAIATSTALNVAAISKRKFIPQRYAEGGIVNGRSHAQGGVPFSVNGRGGYEMEGGEYIVNKEATKAHLADLERINGKTRRSQSKFATGGFVPDGSDNSEILNEIIIALNRPVRAFVTDQDLTKSETERLALTKKTSY